MSGKSRTRPFLVKQSSANARYEKPMTKMTLTGADRFGIAKVRDLHSHEVEKVRVFLCAQGWAHRLNDASAFARLIADSQRTAVAFCGDEVIGFARGITDHQSNGYLSMVAVASEHRRAGLGRALVQHVVGENSGITWMLRADRGDAAGFFVKLGFNSSSVAMERIRG